MMDQLLMYGFGMPAIIILISLVLYRSFSAFNTVLSDPLIEITSNWASFLKNGIPIPSDYDEMGYRRFIGEAFLTRPEYRATEVSLGKR